MELKESVTDETSVIRFKVGRGGDGNDDNDNVENVVPFQVAYAISIHKAQGLEYESVKVVITSEIEEMVSHNTGEEQIEDLLESGNGKTHIGEYEGTV